MAGGRVAGKVAIVSGGARGIGEAIVRALVGEGADVMIGDVLEDEGRAVADDLGRHCAFRRLDVRDADDWTRAVAECIATFGPPNVLVNNAGVMVSGVPIEAATADDFRAAFDVNVLGALLGIQAVVPAMRELGGGSVVMISSLAGVVGTNGRSPYSVSKAGSIALARCAAVELGRDGIRVNAVLPGGVTTEMRAALARETTEGPTAPRRVPLGRDARPEEIANAVLFLCSDESSYATGSQVVVDGGVLA